jgi:hypothetical protein
MRVENEVRRFLEKRSFGRSTGRGLLLQLGAAMPPAAFDCSWVADSKFEAISELESSSGFAQVLASVRKRGFEIVTRRDP